MVSAHACSDYQGMEACPGRFESESEAELWQHIEVHASTAHGEDPAEWSDEDRSQVAALIRTSD